MISTKTRVTSVSTRDKHFHLLEGETLLEGLERTGHEVEYQCRSGYCGMCRMTLIQGNVTYESLPLAFVGPSEVLPCCCTLETPVTVDCGLRSDLDSQYELFREDLLDDPRHDQA
ncbi:class I ribonucleotide reductase maintenance protein YfaE [Kerstersia gyiorum]|uniref:class I ribonucleotide reductase maintenance protein YfaE n=1 Tax=Kerstersia gyiorum TaxID=206506 RepID=UPI00215007C9|nr:class I ribonucleotide reductase maintenance protein YfaE [Kerstersia gyiorum]MCR4157448.1 class I ribonucleotide reductase maintenance protein YfaE [Kerstersia gyiorum]